MGLAVELFFDDKSERIVREMWQALAERDIAPFLWESGSRPHVTLTVFDDADVAELEARVASFARTTPAFRMSFSSIGTFSTDEGVVFLAPKPSEILLRRHRDFQQTLGAFRPQQWPYYAPELWVPHCTMVLEAGRAKAIEAIAALQDLFRPFEATVESVGVVEFRPIRHLRTYSLNGEGA